MKRLGYIPIDRENLRSALKSVKAGTELLKNKTSILIFPEGMRSPDGRLLSFKKGGLNMFLKQGGMTILPVVIIGTVNILKKNSLAIHPGKTVELHILKPLNVVEKGDSAVIIEKIEQGTHKALENGCPQF
jgi:1-acyl-sn-glycerol-3-phosphate acyltransferase